MVDHHVLVARGGIPLLARGPRRLAAFLRRARAESNTRPGLRRPLEAFPGSSKDSQRVAIARDDAGCHSRPSQLFAPFTEDSADRLRTLLTVREVAALMRVSTATVYELCARGELRHARVLNAIRVAASDLRALLLRG